MHRHDGTGATRHSSLNGIRVNVRIFCNVSEDHSCPDESDGCSRREEGVRRGDDFIAGANAHRAQDKVQ
jgi:hypothetical protein